MPVVVFCPRTIAVYLAGGNVCTTADSKLWDGGMVGPDDLGLLSRAPIVVRGQQAAIGIAQLERRIRQRSRQGNDGPIARTITLRASCRVRISPPINTLSPVWTKPRVEILASLESEPASRS